MSRDGIQTQALQAFTPNHYIILKRTMSLFLQILFKICRTFIFSEDIYEEVNPALGLTS